MFSKGLSACDLLEFQSRLEGVCRVQIFDLYSVRDRLVGSSGRRIWILLVLDLLLGKQFSCFSYISPSFGFKHMHHE